MIPPRVPVVPWTECPVYRVLRAPVFRSRRVGGWTATGETALTTSDLAEALRVCFDFKRSNHGFRFHYV